MIFRIPIVTEVPQDTKVSMTVVDRMVDFILEEGGLPLGTVQLSNYYVRFMIK